MATSALLRFPAAFPLALLAGCSAANFVANSTGSAPVPAISVSVTGSADTRLGSSTQFTAAVANSTNPSFTWQVNGTSGGSSALGTITSSGLYTAPAALPSQNPVTISAVSQAAPTISGTLSESIWNPLPAINSATATQTGSAASFLIDVQGSGFVPASIIQVGGASLATTYLSATDVQATYTASASGTVAVTVVNPNPGAANSPAANVQITVAKASISAAARLLDQATFGPTLASIQTVQSTGLDPWITQQFSTAQTVLPDISTPPPSQCTTSYLPCEQSEWWQTVLTAPDQLRQRVAFALSEIFVISTNSVDPRSVITFHNTLAKDAFGNFYTIMKDVATSTGMGAYLNMLQSYKPGNGQIANENFARENMQLFSIGLILLNSDGTPQLDVNGNQIPTYTEAQVQAFARAYTGWTYATSTGGIPAKFPNTTPNFDSPMVALDSAHDVTAKTLLNGTTLPANQTSVQDLTGALTNIFQHQNVGPFLCKQLIQHLVSSNPSPAYVARVSAVFADNGSGVRGDMQAVIRAILEDTEARAGDTNPSFDGGHLREPLLYLANVLRALNFTATDPTGYYGTLSNYSGALSEKPYGSGSVFNFFPPSYTIPGTSTNAPEFGLENTASAILRLTQANQVVYNQLTGFSVDLTATGPLGVMAANPTNLVNYLGEVFMHGQMPSNMQTAIVNHITPMTDMGERARVATYLVITSSQYKINH